MSTGNSFELEETATRLDRPLITLSLLYWAFILTYAITLWIPRPRYTIIFVGGSALVFIVNEASKSLATGNTRTTALLGGLGVITVASISYITAYFWPLFYERPGVYFTHEYVLAFLLVVTIAYLAYRAFGVAFLAVAGIITLYGFAGEFIPGIFGHSGLSATRLLEVYVLDITGFFGSISRIIAAWVALFLLYTGLIQAYGAFDLIMKGVSRVATWSRSGIAQFAVVASMIIGSINGSPSSNAAMTGSVTIPLMKESGLPAEAAGGVEATASSSGQLMPPIMGSAAFVMASLLGITYFDVVTAGLLPAVIFIVSVAVGVHYAVLRYAPEGLSPNIDLDVETEQSRTGLAFDILKFAVPFVVLVYTLGIAQWTIMSAAMTTVFIQIAAGYIFPVLKSFVTNGKALKSVLASSSMQTLDGFRYGAIILAPIAIIIALITGIVDIINATGLPGSLTLALIDIAGGTLLIAAIMSMFICILLGMGMPSVAAYTIVAILVAPTFVESFLIPDIAAHYFVFYSAILSFITPPIATAAVVASGIAGANFWQTCFAAIRIAAVLFVLPIVFLYNPELFVAGGLGTQVLIASIILLGGIAITHGVNYPSNWGPNQIVDWGIRTIYVVGGLVVMVYPNVSVSLGILLIMFTMFVAQYFGSITTTVTARFG